MYTHVSVGVFTEDSLFPIPAGGFNFSTDGATVDAWPYFPGLKVGKMFSNFPCFPFGGVDYKSLWSTIIP